jgi:hypothetical protein
LRDSTRKFFRLAENTDNIRVFEGCDFFSSACAAHDALADGSHKNWRDNALSIPNDL